MTILTGQEVLYTNTDVDIKINVGNNWARSDITSNANSDLVVKLIRGNDEKYYSYRSGNISLANNSITVRINDTDISRHGYYRISARLYYDTDEIYGLIPTPTILKFEE